MFKRALRVAAVSLAVGGIGFAAVAQNNATKPAAGADDPVVARVNGSEIRRSDVLRTITNLPPQVQQMPVQMIYPAIIDQIVNGKLVAQAGYAQKLEKDPAAAERMKRAEERVVQELYLSRAVEQRITDEKLQEAYKHYKEENPSGREPAGDSPAAVAAEPPALYQVRNRDLLISQLLTPQAFFLPFGVAWVITQFVMEGSWTFIGIGGTVTAMAGVLLQPIRRVLRDWNFRLVRGERLVLR